MCPEMAHAVMTIIDELEWRGMVSDCTDTEALTKKLSEPASASSKTPTVSPAANRAPYSRGCAPVVLIVLFIGIQYAV